MEKSIHAPAPGSNMDDFAQTRGADDLFDSEIVAPPQPPPAAPTEPRSQVASRGSSGGGGGRGLWARGAHQGRGGGERTSPGENKEGPQQKSGENAIPQKPADRTLSGGVKKPKLTEEELAERMARIKLNNERLTERRRKAEEDESTFQTQELARKEADAAKRIAERKKKAVADRDRRELDNERERNRQRKLKAVQHREWDVEKKEEDYNPRGYNPRFRRGAHGGVAASPRPPGPHDEEKPTEVLDSAGWPVLAEALAKAEESSKPKIEADEVLDSSGWPVLPEGKAEKNTIEEKDTAEIRPEKPMLPMLSPAIGGGTSWADQVESGTPTTPHT